MKKTTLLVATMLPVLIAGCTNVTDKKADVSKAPAAVAVKAAPVAVIAKPVAKAVIAKKVAVKQVAKVNAAEVAAHAAIKKAKADNDSVREAGFEWNVTKKLIKKAEEAVAAGKFTKATAMAKKASRYTVYGFEQAEHSKTAGPLF